MAQLKNATVWAKGMPCRGAPHLSITRRVTEGDRDSTGEIPEKSEHSAGKATLGFNGVLGLKRRSGFLRWWSLIMEWNLSASKISARERSAEMETEAPSSVSSSATAGH